MSEFTCDQPTFFNFQQIGIIHSCYKQKFGIPRQPGLETASSTELELIPPFNTEALIRGLEYFSHIWVHFIFHQNMPHSTKKNTVRPPRLGGKQRVGIFASRSTHRPNPIGLSVTLLKKIHTKNNRIILELGGADLLDGTPVIDIKPYIPYADSKPLASGGYANEAPLKKNVYFNQNAKEKCLSYEKRTGRNLAMLIKQVICLDPRPEHMKNITNKEYIMILWEQNIVWQAKEDHFTIIDIYNTVHSKPADQ